MDHFHYRNGALSAESVPFARIAAEVGTPFYCYATATLERHYRVFAAAFEGLDAMICYSVKANGNLAIIRTLARLGAGADVVSGGELKRALAAGVAPDKIVFSGVGKSQDELAAALAAGIMQINVESDAELDLLSATAQSLKTKAPVAIRINPNVDAKTHAKITTGKGESKFGIEWGRARAVYRRAAGLPGIEIVGIAVHIGSQLTELDPYKEAYGRMRDLVLALKADGHPIGRLDLGGGLGVPYAAENTERPIPPPAKYGALVKKTLGDIECRFILEPGRLIVGNAGILVTRVLYVKEGESRTFVIVDAAMNDLIRPTLYNAYHAIVPVQAPQPGVESLDVEVVGPICETGDTFGKNHRLPALKPGDLLAIRTAGAYGAVMASMYNGRPLVPEVLAKDDSFAVVRRRVSTEDAMQWETIPPWLEPAAEPKRKVGT